MVMSFLSTKKVASACKWTGCPRRTVRTSVSGTASTRTTSNGRLSRFPLGRFRLTMDPPAARQENKTACPTDRNGLLFERHHGDRLIHDGGALARIEFDYTAEVGRASQFAVRAGHERRSGW